jgi:hypothetical protein
VTPPSWQDWLSIAQDLALHQNEEGWQAHAERVARALNQAWSDGRQFQHEIVRSVSVATAREFPEERGCVDLLEVE